MAAELVIARSKVQLTALGFLSSFPEIASELLIGRSSARLLVRSTRIFAGFPLVIIQASDRKVICSAPSTRIVVEFI